MSPEKKRRLNLDNNEALSVRQEKALPLESSPTAEDCGDATHTNNTEILITDGKFVLADECKLLITELLTFSRETISRQTHCNPCEGH